MANLERWAKPPDEWITYDLDVFNIQVISEDAQTFFGVPESDLPTPQTISPVILNNLTVPTTPNDTLSKTERLFFAYLEDAMRFYAEEESQVKDFVVFLLGLLDYDVGPYILHTRKDLLFYTCREYAAAKADVVLTERRGALFHHRLLVNEDKVCTRSFS